MNWLFAGIVMVGLMVAGVIAERRAAVRRRVILFDLASCEGATGLELVKRHEKLLRRGTIYLDLNRLEDEGLVASAELYEPERRAITRIPRRIYYITAAGAVAVLLRQPGD